MTFFAGKTVKILMKVDNRNHHFSKMFSKQILAEVGVAYGTVHYDTCKSRKTDLEIPDLMIFPLPKIHRKQFDCCFLEFSHVIWPQMLQNYKIFLLFLCRGFVGFK